MENIDLRSLLKKVIEIVMPDLPKYYRIVRKARVVATYASDSQYYCDVQPLNNDESVDESEPVIKRVEIPVIWGGVSRGIVCPPAVGTYCDLEYYDGDPSYPRISNFRWHNNQAPEAEVDELIIQQRPGVHIRITAGSIIDIVTDAEVHVTSPKTIITTTQTHEGAVTINGPLTVNGLLTYTEGLVGSGGGAVSCKIGGKMQATEIVTDDGIDMSTHRHGGVQEGSDTSGGPVNV